MPTVVLARVRKVGNKDQTVAHIPRPFTRPVVSGARWYCFVGLIDGPIWTNDFGIGVGSFAGAPPIKRKIHTHPL